MKKAYANVTSWMNMAGISVKGSPCLSFLETGISNFQFLTQEGNRCRAVLWTNKIPRFKRSSFSSHTLSHNFWRKVPLKRTSWSFVFRIERLQVVLPYGFFFFPQLFVGKCSPLHFIFIWFIALILYDTEVSIADIIRGPKVEICREQMAF